MKYFFGVISKNQVDTIINYSLEHINYDITFIPSRRQIEYNGGYVNNWTTKTFTEYVKKLNPKIKIERDHSGPGQGLIDDDGFRSLEEDCKYFDLIHIDPWKKYPNIDEGIKWSIDMINFCYNLNPSIDYEIGTEEAIRIFTIDELEKIIIEIKNNLHEKIFKKIKYCVVQSGNMLINCNNLNKYNETRLKDMIYLIKKYGFITKEHNGDWLPIELLKEKSKLGLECLNIAPEFGEIESKVILDKIKTNLEHYEEIYNLCINSGKWKKWVTNDFDYLNRKDEIILICCHYIYSDNKFLEIKNQYLNIDNKIKKNIKNKLNILYNLSI